jgi:hypothetical protein
MGTFAKAYDEIEAYGTSVVGNERNQKKNTNMLKPLSQVHGAICGRYSC